MVIQLRNIHQQTAHFPNYWFNSILGVFSMFRTSCVHHQVDHLYRQFYDVFHAFM